MGSDSDLPVMQAAADILKYFGIDFELTIVSAHRTPVRMVDFGQGANWATIVDIGGPSPSSEDHDHEGGHAHGLRHLPSMLRSRLAQNPGVARNHGDGIVALLATAGFEDAREVDHLDHRFGPVTFVQATRP